MRNVQTSKPISCTCSVFYNKIINGIRERFRNKIVHLATLLDCFANPSLFGCVFIKQYRRSWVMRSANLVKITPDVRSWKIRDNRHFLFNWLFSVFLFIVFSITNSYTHYLPFIYGTCGKVRQRSLNKCLFKKMQIQLKCYCWV